MDASRTLQQRSRPLRTTTIMGLATLGLLIGPPALVVAGGVCDDPDNRTLNCDFATDIYGWVLELGTSSSHSLDGNIGPGSIEVQSEPDAPDELIKINQCVGGLAGLTTIDIGASFRIASGTPYGCGIEAEKYSDDNCTSYMGAQGFYFYVYSHWSRIGKTIDIDPSIRGIRISPICFSSTGVFSVRIDDIYLGVGVGAIIFNDDFESGSTTAWDL